MNKNTLVKSRSIQAGSMSQSYVMNICKFCRIGDIKVYFHLFEKKFAQLYRTSDGNDIGNAICSIRYNA